MAKILINFLIVIILIASNVYAGTDDNEVDEELHMYGGVKIHQIEKNCALVGGLCVEKTDCNQQAHNGLCPSNQHNGVECCFELKTRPAPCAQHAGECMDFCHRALHRPGTDCTNGQVCCVLVN